MYNRRGSIRRMMVEEELDGEGVGRGVNKGGREK